MKLCCEQCGRVREIIPMQNEPINPAKHAAEMADAMISILEKSERNFRKEAEDCAMIGFVYTTLHKELDLAKLFAEAAKTAEGYAARIRVAIIQREAAKLVKEGKA